LKKYWKKFADKNKVRIFAVPIKSGGGEMVDTLL
jgi:hypothetical protein